MNCADSRLKGDFSVSKAQFARSGSMPTWDRLNSSSLACPADATIRSELVTVSGAAVVCESDNGMTHFMVADPSLGSPREFAVSSSEVLESNGHLCVSDDVQEVCMSRSDVEVRIFRQAYKSVVVSSVIETAPHLP